MSSTISTRVLSECKPCMKGQFFVNLLDQKYWYCNYKIIIHKMYYIIIL